MKVPIVDLHKQYLSIRTEIDGALQQVIASSQFILGGAVQNFEESFARSHEMKHCIGVGSGTDAIHAALWASGVGPGDAVITTPFTFIGTTEAISLTGAQPLFVDIDPATYTMDVNKFEELVKTGRAGLQIRAVIPIHLYGHPAAMNDIGGIADRFGLTVIEDACQSHLARYNGKYVGHFGSTACFSFYPTKNLGAFGEAGAITTNDDATALRLRRLRDHGQTEKYRHEFEGHNYRMDGIQGAVLAAKLPHLETWTLRRRQIAGMYKEGLNGVGDLVLPVESANAYHVYHLFVIRTGRRSDLAKFLASREIGTSISYPIPLHLQRAYERLGYPRGSFAVSEQVAEECLSLPIYPEMSDEQVEYVIRGIQDFFHD